MKTNLSFTISFFFFFNDTATTEIYTLSLHDALPISTAPCDTSTCRPFCGVLPLGVGTPPQSFWQNSAPKRSEEHTSELQSRQYLVCRLLLEKKKKQKYSRDTASKL